MVIRGNSRGNARQLSRYLLTKGDNEAIRILDVDGQWDATPEDLHRAVFAMGLSAELSKSDKGLYHAQINPAIGEDAAMGDDGWLQACDLLAGQLGLQRQRRAVVLHTKKGRTHAHVVWERYDHEKEKMVPDSFSRLAQDRARKEIEAVFGHEPTPHRNKHRPELKASLLRLWNQTSTGAQFVTACRANDYYIAEGSGRSPFVVVDERGHSFDLARQLKGVKLRDVRQRLRHEHLMSQQMAITTARNAAASGGQDGRAGDKTGKQRATFRQTQCLSAMNISYTFKGKDGSTTAQSVQTDAPSEFSQNKALTQPPASEQPGVDERQAKSDFAATAKETTGQDLKQPLKEKFAENKRDTTEAEGKPEKTDKRREEFKKRMEEMDVQRAKDKNKGLDLG